jgi:SAM-dependent methyltransferase
LAAHGLIVFAFDFSDVVERAEMHRHEFAGDGVVHFLLADAQHPPFDAGFFDLVYSDGVVHLTAQPKLAFSELARVLKPGGMLFVSVSRKDRTLPYRLHRLASEAFRRIALRLPIRVGRWMGLAVASVLTLADSIRWIPAGSPRGERVSVSQRAFALWHSSVLAHHEFLESEELQSWFRGCGLTGVEDCTIPELGRTGCAARGTLLPSNAPEQPACRPHD